MISGDKETMHGSATKCKLYRSPSIARIVTFRKVHVGHVGRTEQTRDAHNFGGNIPCKMSTYSVRMNWEDDINTDTRIMVCKVDRTS
jgi:hypothetical protein